MSMNFEPDGRLRVFCSLPMSGKSDDQIKKAIQSMHAWFFLTQTVENGRNYRTDEIAWVDNFDFIPVHPLIPVKVPSTKTRAYCLGEALKRMATCDIVLFSPEWTNATGCRFEMDICRAYHIPYIIAKEGGLAG